MEAMASGLPCIVSKIRGNVELITPENGSYFDPTSENDIARALNIIAKANKNLIKNTIGMC